jgi:hypothetical protein
MVVAAAADGPVRLNTLSPTARGCGSPPLPRTGTAAFGGFRRAVSLRRRQKDGRLASLNTGVGQS